MKKYWILSRIAYARYQIATIFRIETIEKKNYAE